MASAIDLLMSIVENCLSLCCLSVHFYFDLESFEEKGSPNFDPSNATRKSHILAHHGDMLGVYCVQVGITIDIS